MEGGKCKRGAGAGRQGRAVCVCACVLVCVFFGIAISFFLFAFVFASLRLHRPLRGLRDGLACAFERVAGDALRAGGLSKLTWLVLGGDPAARSHRVEHFTAL